MSKFFAFVYRMKYIMRWSLMRNTQNENVAEHSYHVAVLAHALAVISRDVFKTHISPEGVAACALYHDMPEILTGDMPTPVKYFNPEIRKAYSEIESFASDKLLSMLPNELKNGIAAAALPEDPEVSRLVRAADKLAAYIKCLEERRAGNHDFVKAEEQIKDNISKMKLPELEYFIDKFIPAFSLTLDELD